MDKSEYRLIRLLAFLIRVGSNNYWLINNSLIAITIIITLTALLESFIGTLTSIIIAIVLTIVFFIITIIVMINSNKYKAEDSGKID